MRLLIMGAVVIGVVRRGRRLGVPTPLLARLNEMIGEIELGKRKQSPRNLVDLAATLS